MTVKEELLSEIEQTSDEVLEEILNFLLFTKARHEQRKESPAVENSPTSNEQPSSRSSHHVGKSIWQMAEDFVKDLPPEELAKLPKDGAEQHDHYIYGTPKIES